MIERPPEQQRCIATVKSTGEQCQGWKLSTGGNYCHFHSDRNRDSRDIIFEIEQGVFQDLFPEDQSSWNTWKTILRGIWGLEMSDEEVLVWKNHTGRGRTGPNRKYRNIYMVCPRRSGKSFIASLITVHQAMQNWKRFVRSGETAEAILIASDREQARVCFNYCLEILETPRLARKKLIKRQTQSIIELTNGVTIRIATASFRGIRGRTVISAVCDEIAFWRIEGANPDKEIIRSIRPGMATVPKSMLICVSSPYIRSGVLWDNFKEFYGKDRASTLVIKGASQEFNPTLDLSFIQDELKLDPEARSEWYPEFRLDLEGFLPGPVIDGCVIPGRQALPFKEGNLYQAFCDSSSGRKDSFTLSVAHRDEKTNMIVVDLAYECKSPFQPSQAIKTISDLLKSYKLVRVTGDRYASGFVLEGFRENGIMYEVSEWTASECYIEAQPLLISQQVELPDNDTLIEQFKNLERKNRPGGKPQVSHPSFGNFHDDVSNSVAGALTLVCRKPRLTEAQLQAMLPSKIKSVPAQPKKQARLEAIKELLHFPGAGIPTKEN